MKRNYLLSVIVMGLIVLSLYSTYAMFTETIETDEIINMDASLIPLESKIIEYEQITINGNQAKSIMVNISNSTESNLYYGVWYEMVNPTSINSNIEIAKLTSSTDSTQGQINVGVEKNVKIVIKNTGSSSITVNIGVGYSETNSLDLPINRYVITNEIQGKYIINTSVTNGSTTTPTKIVDVGNSTSIVVKPNTGYKYKSVSCTNAEASYNTGNNTLTLTNITDDVSCTVTNEIIKYNVTAKASTGGTVSGTSTKTVNYNSSTTFTVMPNTGYQYSSVSCPSGITGSYSTSTNILTVSNVKASGTCTVNFSIKKFTVTAKASTGGTVSGTSSKTVNYNGSTTFTVKPNTGYQYSSVSCPSGITGSYSTSNNTLTVSGVKANGTCTVNFTKKTYTVRVSVTNGTSSPTSRTVSHGSSTTFTVKPNTGYEFESLSCTGGRYNESTKVLTVSNVTSTRTCTIKFKQSFPANSASYIESLLASNPTTMNNDDPDGNVRYMGANPNNYVSFNNELWRIIGVFDVASTYNGPTEKRLKIIRDETIGTMSWDNKPSGTGSSTSSYGSNDWSDSALMEVLNNGAYWNRTIGVCPSGEDGAPSNCDFSTTGLTEEAKTLIGDAVWNLGGTADYTSASNRLASHFYGYERGTTVYSGRPTYWVGKIGLMYPSDYGYATSGGTTHNRAFCLDRAMFFWNSSGYSDCKNNDYLYNSSLTQWTITPDSEFSDYVFYVAWSGTVLDFWAFRSILSASPVLYLKSTVQITGGEGSSSSPYTLG